MMNAPMQSPASLKQSDPLVWSALSLVWKIGYLIAIPAFILGFGGAFLDKQYGTTPLITIIGLTFALIFSGFAVYRKVKHTLR